MILFFLIFLITNHYCFREVASQVDEATRLLIQSSVKKHQVHLVYASLFLAIVMGICVFFVSRKIISNVSIVVKKLSKEGQQIEELEHLLDVSSEKLAHQLYVDSLTRLDNRKALERDLENMSEPKLVLLDIDGFRDINEYYGRSVADFVLIEVSNLLKEFATKKKIKLYRVGSDEFGFLEDALLDVERYEQMAIELTQLLKGKMIRVPSIQNPIELNVAIGFSLEKEDVFEKAEMALFEAKKREIDYLCYFQKIEKTTLYAEQIKWSNSIKRALDKELIVPYYQPIFDNMQRVVKHECLVRILNDHEEAIAPSLFLNISKKVKRYAEIEKMLIDKSFKEISGTEKIISLNLLARDMTDSNISNYVVSKLKEYGVAKQVIFEILEDESIESLDRVEIFINRVKRMGVKIAIDDFGTGYSNFSYLLKLQPDYIKIDGSLIREIDKDKKSEAIVSAIVIFAKKLDIKTIAEYVCNESVYSKCKALGVDEFQGFYLGEPNSKLRDF
ncbi:MAG: GGDEF and EAL domain-containing protein [Sulfurospirillaceae bacterium]|nr:GGDEF and EAL domain-containing protein [Sulfurospirillaceae bacterium]